MILPAKARKPLTQKTLLAILLVTTSLTSLSGCVSTRKGRTLTGGAIGATAGVATAAAVYTPLYTLFGIVPVGPIVGAGLIGAGVGAGIGYFAGGPDKAAA